MRTLRLFQSKFNLALRYKLQKISVANGKSLNKPTYICIKITERCNAQCHHCDIWKIGKPYGELTTTQWKETIIRLRRWLGPFFLVITGGEPFLRQDIVELTNFATRQHVFIELLSNGWLLNHEIAEQLVKIGLYRCTISLDGINPLTHDTFRGISGFHMKTTNALNYLKKFKDKYHSPIQIVIKTVVMKHNLDELETLVSWVKEKGFTGIIFQPIEQNYSEPVNPNWYKTSQLWISDLAKLTRTMDNLIRLKETGAPILNRISDFNMMKEYFMHPERLMQTVQEHANVSAKQICYHGTGNFVISSNGDVRMCFQMEPIGNVIHTNPKQIWNTRSICWKMRCPYRYQ
jgi:MoaA/NifB/PqqE/SkfB family radical SAM enzyme